MLSVRTGGRGQPSLIVNVEQIEFLLSLRFSVRQIAGLLGVSQITVRRRMSAHGMCVRDRYSQLSAAQVDSLVRDIVHSHPHSGYRLVQSYVNTQGVRLTERVVRESLNRVDPVGVAVRWSHQRCIPRRVYSVPHPNALWHIDGNMRLVRWRFPVHGAIDGYSRLITYLECSTNNRAATVLRHFTNAIRVCGCPLRVRSDFGGENIEVAQLMVLLRGTNRGSHITGRSTRNQRIERLWRDVFLNCLSVFYDNFYMMEASNILDPDIESHLIALHYVYQPRIQESLNSFRTAWNNHGIRTAHRASPMQMWTAGMLSTRESQRSRLLNVNVRGLFQLPPNDDTESEDNSSDDDIEDVDDSHQEIIDVLRRSVDPLAISDIHAVDIYVQALQIVMSHQQ